MRLGISFDDHLDLLLSRLGRLPVIREALCRTRGHAIKMDVGACIRCGRGFSQWGDRWKARGEVIHVDLRKERTR